MEISGTIVVRKLCGNPSYCVSKELKISSAVLDTATRCGGICTGQMLYLPAGWFHEVTSFSNPEPDQATSTSGGLTLETSPDKPASFHMALNYWLHPPDNLTPGSEGFSKPYLSGYWPSVWSRKVEMCPFVQSLIRQQAPLCGTAAAPASNQHRVSATARKEDHDRPKQDHDRLTHDSREGMVHEIAAAVLSGSFAPEAQLSGLPSGSQLGSGSQPATSAPGPALQSSGDSSQAIAEPGDRLPGNRGAAISGGGRVRPDDVFDEGLKAPKSVFGRREGKGQGHASQRVPCSLVAEGDRRSCGCGGPAGGLGGVVRELRESGRKLCDAGEGVGAGRRQKGARDLRVRFSGELEAAAADLDNEGKGLEARGCGTGSGLGETREALELSSGSRTQPDEAWARAGAKGRRLEGRKETAPLRWRSGSPEVGQPRMSALTDAEFEDALAEAKDGLDFIDALLRRKLRQGPRGSSRGPRARTHVVKEGGAGSRGGQWAQGSPTWLAGRDRSHNGWCQLIALGRRQHLVPFLQGPDVFGSRTS